MRHNDLPPNWRARVEAHARQLSGGRRETLGADAFHQDEVAILEFEDGSTARFNHPLLLHDEEREEVCVLTEHCGYHVFRTPGLRIRLEDH